VDRSYTDYVDILKDIDWQMGVDRSRFPKRPETCWLFGTAHWSKLSSAQQLDVAWNEMGRDVSMFIWLEQLIPPLFVGYVNRHESTLHPSVRDYLMIFCKEEILHTLMFRKYLSLAGLPLFAPIPRLFELFESRLPRLPPLHGIALTHIGETLAELGAMYNTDFTEVDPLTRKVIREHHREEARHIAFGRLLIESQLENKPDEIAELRPLVELFLTPLIEQYNYDIELDQWVTEGTPLPLADSPQIALVRNSQNNRRLTQERFGSLFRWLQRWGLVSETYNWGIDSNLKTEGV
jgi:hypothetical protein